ncbi:MAG: FecR family protein [Pseudobacter sp.]|uniref:FecR family protein n=1 Tax=Pseudobacter sp. TaxID=2045420 RepID=UPI003F80F7B1
MTTVDQIADILLRHLQGNLSEAEQQQLQQWLEASAQRRHFFAQLDDEEKLREQLMLFLPGTEQATEQAILAKIHDIRNRETAAEKEEAIVLPLWKRGWVRYAAAVVLMAGGITYFWMAGNNDKPVNNPESLAKTEILPGKTGAVLTLADGRQVVLDSAGNGVIATESGTQVILDNGKLLYDLDKERGGAIQFNTMSTPKGRQFQVVLPDGTKVWLNAASSIRYPVAFAPNERKVYVEGEAYFEVAKDMHRPFLVGVNNTADVEVLGTEFNVNAYDNEKMVRTTLVNGGVRVSAQQAEPTADGRSSDVVLKPGQQAKVVSIAAGNAPRNGKNPVTIADDVDIEQITAWKNGFFNFGENVDLGEMMRQLERWYDIEVVYENGVPEKSFLGEIPRHLPLKDVLDILQRTEVSFRLEEGRRLIVLNK